MAKRNIIKLGDEILRKQSKPVEVFDEKLWTLLDDMKETMYAIGGVGLAAVQVGILKRATVIDTGEPEEGGLMELINPVITKSEGSKTDREGCLSIPDREEKITRPETVWVSAQDRHGNKIEVSGSGYLARALCHEIDHMNGVLYIDKI